jgi:hypothetical protein
MNLEPRGIDMANLSLEETFMKELDKEIDEMRNAMMKCYKATGCSMCRDTLGIYQRRL